MKDNLSIIITLFKTPADNRTDYIKRLIALPGDTIQFIDWDIYLNNNQILKTKVKNDIRFIYSFPLLYLFHLS